MLTYQQQLEKFAVPVGEIAAKQIVRRCQQIIDRGDPPTGEEICLVAEVMIHYHAVTSGLIVIDVSPAEAELYAQTDLHAVDPQEWQQSYPLILVKMPANISDRVMGVLSLPELTHNGGYAYPVNLLSFYDRKQLDHAFVSKDFEEAFRVTLGHVADSTISTVTGRIAINAVLHMANYPELYGRHSDALNRVIVRQKDKSGEMKRRELVPQIIRLRQAVSQPVEVAPHGSHQSAEGGGSGTSGTSKRPHWRRGHWRRVAFGTGRTERRHTWIKPVLVNAALVVGETRAVATYRD